MQRPRGRPPVISRERLLDVAREVFLELGIRATTSAVAARAGVAEGTIFHRFKSKDELFRAAMEFDPYLGLSFVDDLPARAGHGDPRRILSQFAEQLIEFGRVAMPVQMMSWSNPEYHLIERASERDAQYRRIVGSVSAYFQAELAGGRIGGQKPEVLARMLIGSLHHFCMIELLTSKQVGRIGAMDFARAVVDTLLDAAAPRTTTSRARRAKRPSHKKQPR